MPSFKKLAALTGVAEMARRYAQKNPDKVRKYAAQAGAFVDKQTKGKYHRHIDGAVRKVDDTVRRDRPDPRGPDSGAAF